MSGEQAARLRGWVQDELLRTANLREPGVCVVRVVVETRDGARRAHEYLGEGAVEARRVAIGGDRVGHKVRPRDVLAHLLVLHEWRPRVAIERHVALIVGNLVVRLLHVVDCAKAGEGAHALMPNLA